MGVTKKLAILDGAEDPPPPAPADEAAPSTLPPAEVPKDDADAKKASKK